MPPKNLKELQTQVNLRYKVRDAFKYFAFFQRNNCVKKTGVLGDHLSALSFSVHELALVYAIK